MNYNKEREIQLVEDLRDAMDELHNDRKNLIAEEQHVRDSERRVAEIQSELRTLGAKDFNKIWDI